MEKDIPAGVRENGSCLLIVIYESTMLENDTREI